MVNLIREGNPFIVEYLIRRGGDPNARGRHESTPLHSAAWGRNQRVVEILLENGAEVDALTDEDPVAAMPIDGLQVGSDLNGAVGECPAGNPLKGTGNDWEIVEGLPVNDFARERIDGS